LRRNAGWVWSGKRSKEVGAFYVHGKKFEVATFEGALDIFEGDDSFHFDMPINLNQVLEDKCRKRGMK
jgi:hypothetical protein